MKRSTPIKRKKPIARVSAKRRKEMAQYTILREAFLRSNPLDAAWLKLDGYTDEEIDDLQKTALIILWESRNLPSIYARNNEHMILKGLPQKCPRSNELHHSHRRGRNYLNVATFVATSSTTHKWIEMHAMDARRAGLLAY